MTWRLASTRSGGVLRSLGLVVLMATACTDSQGSGGLAGGSAPNKGRRLPDLAEQVVPVFANSTGRRVCRSTLSARPAAVTLLDRTGELGGRTCYAKGKIVLFIPTWETDCVAPAGLKVESAENLSLQEGERQYLACSAFSSPTSLGHSVTFTPTAEVPQEDRVFFLQFGIDAGVLISNDGLPVSAYYPEQFQICMETDVPAEVAERVRAADIVNFDYVDVEIRHGRCRR